jgi:hypothetical protein
MFRDAIWTGDSGALATKLSRQNRTLRAAGALEREADKRAVKAAFDLCSLRQASVPVETACAAIAILWSKPPKPVQ